MDTNEHKFPLEVFQVVGCAMEVLNRLHGLLEKPRTAFSLQGHAFKLSFFPT